MLHIYHGDGKGKTTAALGLVMCQLGHAQKVLVVQFLKDGKSGEISFLKQQPLVTCLYSPMPKLFYYQMGQEMRVTTALSQHALFETAEQTAAQYACILLDEALDALQLGILQEIEMLAFLNANKAREIILTGRNPSKNILACGDYITQMKMEKHPYQKQQAPRKGVEY